MNHEGQSYGHRMIDFRDESPQNLWSAALTEEFDKSFSN